MDSISSQFDPVMGFEESSITDLNVSESPLSPDIHSNAREALSALWKRLNVESGIYFTDTVADQPLAEIRYWNVQRVSFADGTCSSHLLGVVDGEVRVTTAVQSIDTTKRTAATQSGRNYLLYGDFGYNMHAEYLFKAWLRGRKAVKVVNLTHKLRALLRNGVPMRAPSKLAELDSTECAVAVDEVCELDASQIGYRSMKYWERI